MGDIGLFSMMDIGTTGVMAERMRMNVIANNIANANTTKAADGKPYRRQVVVFTSEFQKELQGSTRGAEKLGGVKVKEIKTDKDPFKEMYIPGHPEANKDGIVLMPNIDTSNEMIDMMTASRSYEANLAIMRAAQKMINRTMQAFGSR